jgi:hypothetical protein
MLPPHRLDPQVGQHAVLVPYRRKFVRRYHEWMKDPFLQGTDGRGRRRRRHLQTQVAVDQRNLMDFIVHVNLGQK